MGNSQQAHDVVTTSMRRMDVVSTSCAHKVVNKSVPKFKDRIERNSFASTFKSN